MPDLKPHDVANVWVVAGAVHANFFHVPKAARFDSLDKWREDRLWADMCDICNGSRSDHFTGCPNDWGGVWD